jgi:hypothetical protein
MHDHLRKQLETGAAIGHIKRQQIKWFEHVIRHRELKITQRVINKKCEITKQGGQENDTLVEYLRLWETYS